MKSLECIKLTLHFFHWQTEAGKGSYHGRSYLETRQCPPFKAGTGYFCLNWPGIVENSTGKRKKFMYIRFTKLQSL